MNCSMGCGSPAGLGPILSPGQRHCSRPGSVHLTNKARLVCLGVSVRISVELEEEIQTQAVSLPGCPERPGLQSARFHTSSPLRATCSSLRAGSVSWCPSVLSLPISQFLRQDRWHRSCVKRSLIVAHLGCCGWHHGEVMVLEAQVVGRRGTSAIALSSQDLWSGRSAGLHGAPPGVGTSSSSSSRTRGLWE